MPVEIMC